jgi:nitroreductase
MITDLVKQNRSHRRFQQDKPLPLEMLRKFVELARLVPSAANLQPLKYILSNTPEKNNLIFPCLRWAGYLKEWPGPGEGERPVAHIVILGDKGITENFGCDHGIAAQTILLAAVEMGLRGCMIASIKRDELRAALNIPEHFHILLDIALGYPNETVVIEEMKEGDVKYWHDEKGIHHVPKRTLVETIVDL